MLLGKQLSLVKMAQQHMSEYTTDYNAKFQPVRSEEDKSKGDANAVKAFVLAVTGPPCLETNI